MGQEPSRVSSPLSAIGMSSSGLSTAREECERKLFCDCLRDGFVLCQLINTLCQCSVVKPDPRKDGFAWTSNITKFLALCESYGMQSEDLFLQAESQPKLEDKLS